LEDLLLVPVLVYDVRWYLSRETREAKLGAARSMPAIIGYGAGLAIVMSAFDYTGGSLFGYARDPTVDEYDRKEALRKNRRRPIQETIEELGEGRG